MQNQLLYSVEKQKQKQKLYMFFLEKIQKATIQETTTPKVLVFQIINILSVQSALKLDFPVLWWI